MNGTNGGQPRRDDDSAHLGDASLARERSEADQYLKQERALIDSAVKGLDEEHPNQAARKLLTQLKDRTRSQRERTDYLRARSREATDVDLVEEHSGEREVRASLRQQLELAARRAHNQDQALWKVLTEVNVISTAINDLRLLSIGTQQEQEMLGLVGEIDVAAERVLEIAARILDPEHARPPA